MTCFECGKGKLQKARIRIEGTRNGETFEVEVDGLRCEGCGFQTLDNSDSANFTQALSDAYRNRHGLLTGAEIRQRRGQLKMTQQEFADYLGVGVASVKRWENGQVQERGLDELIRIKTDACEARKNLEALQQGLQTNNVLATWESGPASSFELQFSTGRPSEALPEIKNLPLEVPEGKDGELDYPLAA